MEPFERLSVVITVARNLVEILEKETDHLRAMQVEQIDRLQGEKAALADLYAEEVAALRRDPALLGGLDMAVRREFETAMRAAQTAIRRNAQAVDAARHVVEKMIRRLGRSSQAQGGAPAYGPTGASQGAAGSLGRRAEDGAAPQLERGRVIPVAFDQQV
ncbi:MAG: hypothetical protein KDE35_01185 [Geminicoccaceae bacterium]|nr:hypothetical protein [Geminicoccaceae bacterium]